MWNHKYNPVAHDRVAITGKYIGTLDWLNGPNA